MSVNAYLRYCAARGLDGFERKPGGLRRRPAQYLVGILASLAWDNFAEERGLR